MSLALVHSAGPVRPELQVLARRRMLALMVLAWEDNRRLSLRLVDCADQVRELGKAHAMPDWTVPVLQLQVLSSFARVRAQEILALLVGRGVGLRVRLRADELYAGLLPEIGNLERMTTRYTQLRDLAMVEADAEVVDRVCAHAEELTQVLHALVALTSSPFRPPVRS